MSPKYFQGHHDCVLHDFSVVLEVEDMNGGIVGTGGHEGVLFVETDVVYGFLMELHGLVGFCR